MPTGGLEQLQLAAMLRQIGEAKPAAEGPAGLMNTEATPSGGWAPPGGRNVNWGAVFGGAAPANRSAENRSGEGGGYAGGEDPFRSMGLMGPDTSDWMPGWLQQQTPGTAAGLTWAERAKWIGKGIGLLSPVPGGSYIGGRVGEAIGDNYIRDHYFQNDWVGEGPDPGPVGGPLDDFNRTVFSEDDAFTQEARQSSSPVPRGSEGRAIIDPGGGRMSQVGNRHAGMRTDFRTQWNWAHGGGGGGGASPFVPYRQN